MSNPEAERFAPQELQRLAGIYDVERYLFETVTAQFALSGTLTPYDFFTIVIWKSNRTKTKIIRGLATNNMSVETLMQNVYDATLNEARVTTLVEVPGIGLAMASAILTVCYPSEFSILDYRTWDTLATGRVPNLARRYPVTPTEYLQYCAVCQQVASSSGLSLRDLDRALWAQSWERDLLTLLHTLSPG